MIATKTKRLILMSQLPMTLGWRNIIRSGKKATGECQN
jgi:hypothetical protein